MTQGSKCHEQIYNTGKGFRIGAKLEDGSNPTCAVNGLSLVYPC
jgi:hypothetical protein